MCLSLFPLSTIISAMCIVFHLRKTNQMVMDSCCRGGIVHSRGGRSCALFVRPQSPKALWRFRVSTANSLSGRTWLHTHTHIRHIYYIYAQQDIQMYEDDLLQPPKRQYQNPKALFFLRKYLSISRLPLLAAYAHAYSLIGHLFATQYLTISQLPCNAAV